MEKITINGVEYMLTPVENETVNKTEPKFKVGDWIVNRLGNIWHIDSFDAKNYQVTNTKGEHNYFPINIQDRMHLWTIADAKPGDVLATEPIDAYPSPFVAIYKIRRPDYFNSYCLIRFDGKFYEADTGHSIENIYPATKEQRDLLFQKMKEAGYEWDAEKKELNKIHVIDEGKAEMDYCFTKMMNGEKVSSAWSEEDENNINSIVSKLEVDISYWESRSKTRTNEDKKLIGWLKSLRPQNRWKPSDEQITVLESLIENRSIQRRHLVSLYEQLKNLKRE